MTGHVKKLSRVREALRDRVVTQVAEKTGLHPNTIYGIKNNKSESVSASTLDKLYLYLFGKKA